MKYNIILMLVILTVFLCGTGRLAAAVEIALEAELAQEIVEPMIIADDKNASDGKFIWMEGAAAAGGGGTGHADFIINIPEPGKYALWGHVIAWDGNSDSFWVTWQPADPRRKCTADPEHTVPLGRCTRCRLALGPHQSLVRRWHIRPRMEIQ